MNKEQLQQRFIKLRTLAEKNGVEKQFNKLIRRIQADLENINPNTVELENRLDILEKNINDATNPELVLQKLKGQLTGRISEIKNHELNQFDPTTPLSFHPFELLQYDNIEKQISDYLNSLRQLLVDYQTLIKKLPTQAEHKEELTEFITEKERLEKRYHEIKETKPQINRIKSEDSLKKMINEHPDKIDIPGYAGQTLFIVYAVRGKQNMMALLLENGANINAQTDLDSGEQGNTALIWLIANAHANEALWLISVGNQYKINWDLFGHGNTALHLAIAKGPTHVTDTGKKVPGGFREIIKNLIDQGADVNLQDKANGFSPLHLAVLHRDIDVIQQLIQKGANLNCVDKQNRTPLDMLNISRADTKEILSNQCAVFTLNEDDWKKRGDEIRKLLQPEQSSSTELSEDSEFHLSENLTNEIYKLSQHAQKIKMQREGKTKSQKIDELVELLSHANSLEDIQNHINNALKSEYKKGRQQNPLLVNRGPFHAHWIHSLFSKKRNFESQRLSRSTTEDLLIDLKKVVDDAIIEKSKPNTSSL